MMATGWSVAQRRNIVLCYFEKQMTTLVCIEKKMLNEIEQVL